MFNPRTTKIQELANRFPERIQELEQAFDKKTNLYIDYANVFHWQEYLGWHIDIKRLKQLLDSFNTIQKVRLYGGTLLGNQESEDWVRHTQRMGYDTRTKPVKIMRLSIDVSSIPTNSPALLETFIKKSLLLKLDLGTIEFLNQKLSDLNRKGILYLEEKKCNFDVEIGSDMSLDSWTNSVENFILWSGDSDFVDIVDVLLDAGKKVVVFATARRISKELSETKAQIFDIRKIKEFICWPRELREQ